MEKIMTYKTGRIYDFEQRLEIIAVNKNLIIFQDPSRHIMGTINLDSSASKRFGIMNDHDIKRSVLGLYDSGEYDPYVEPEHRKKFDVFITEAGQK